MQLLPFQDVFYYKKERVIMTDNQIEGSQSTEVPSEKESTTQEEWEDARGILFQDVDEGEAKQLSSLSRAPVIRRLNFPINPID